MVRKNNLLVVAVISLFLILLANLAYSLEVPPLKGRVNDYADMISPKAETILEEKLKALEDTDSTQVVILTIPSLEGEAIEEYSIRVVDKWKLGQKGLDNGVLLLVSRNDRRVRIEVGYGLEGRLTDLLSGRIIDYVIVPQFKRGNFDEGFIEGVDAITAAVRGEYKAIPKKEKEPENEGAKFFPFFILIVIIAMLGSRRRWLGGIVGAILFPLIALFMFPLGWLFLLLLAPVGFFGGLLLPLFFFAAGSGRHHGGPFIGGGFSSGGFGGGISSGGFSGGGGGFGGGGASGGW